MEKHDGRKRTQEAQQEIRNLVVSLKKQKHSNNDIATMVGLSKAGVCLIWKKYREGGAKAILLKKRGRRSEKKLMPKEARQVRTWIIDTMPEQLKLPYALWTREAVGKLMYDRFGVDVSKWTVGRYLRDWGFTSQKPIYRAYEQNSEEVRRWLEEEYPRIKKSAEAAKAVIYWGDETGMRSDHHAGKTYGRRGETPVVEATGQRFKANMISAISNRKYLKFMIFKTGFTSDVFIDFLERLIKRSHWMIYLIVDNHKVHKSVQTREWLRRHADRIKLFFLPGYSPDLNPDEYLNQDVKTNALGKQRPRDQSELISNVTNYLYERQQQPETIHAYFQAAPVRYAA